MVKNEKKNIFLQYAAAFTTSITAIGFVCAYAWPSPALPFLTGENSDFPVSKRQGSWIASLYPVGLIIGYIINPLFIDRISRKGTLLMFTCPQIASWVLIILSKNHIHLYIARIIGGIGYGGGISATTVYISEIGDIKNRGIFLVLMKFLMNFGFLFTMILGAFLSYRNMNIVLLMMPFLFAIIFFFMPDSLYFWDINKRKEEEEMMKLNPSKEKEIIFKNEEKLKDCNFKERRKFSLKDTIFWKFFAIPNNRRALEITLFIGVINIFSGHSGITTFTQQIFTYEECILPPEKATVVLATVTVIFSLLSTQFVERIKRKFLLLFTGIISSSSIALVGLFFFLKEKNVDVSYFEWVPIFGLTTFDVMLSCGMGNLFYIYQGELFASDIKSAAISFNKIFYMGLSFIFLLMFQDFIDAVGFYYAYWIFSLGTFLGTCILYTLTPETKGKSLDEIQLLLKSKKIFL